MPIREFDRGEWMEGIRKISALILPVLLALSFLLSCSAPSSYVQKEPVKGIYHRVKKGETFWSIARAYHIKTQDLAEANNVDNPDSIAEGSVLFVPDANQVIDDVMTSVRKMEMEDKAAAGTDALSVKAHPENNNGKNALNDANKTVNSEKKALPPARVPEETKGKKLMPREDKSKSPVDEKEHIQFEKKLFSWPLEEHTVKTRFGIQPNKTYHNWIKIVSVAGAPVKAAADGVVIFASPLKDYGKTIIMRHKNSYATVYTHLKKVSVKTDKKIKKGDIIALIGETDESGDTYMNFEVRLHGKARNPLFFLP